MKWNWLICLLIFMTLPAGCAKVPPHGGADIRIMIYSEAWHSVLVLPDPQGVEEWSYGEKSWFMEGHHSPWNALRALFWPHPGVIMVTHARRPYFEREPGAIGHVWKLQVTPAGLARLHAYLEAGRASPAPLRVEGDNTWYAARRRYDLLYNCNHYLARGLRQAGIPLHVWPCWFPQGLWWQLDRLAQREHAQCLPSPVSN